MSNTNKQLDSNTAQKQLIEISHAVGKRLDLIQGGGGNTSVKASAELMHIKASGTALKAMNKEKGSVALNRTTGQPMNVKETERASMEWAMHLHLPRYVIHCHSVYTNVFACMKDEGENWLLETFSQYAPLYIHYVTPGPDLAKAIHDDIRRYRNDYDREPEVFFLENHGLITCGDDMDRVLNLAFDINDTIQNYLQNAVTDFQPFSKEHVEAAQPPEHPLFPDAAVFTDDTDIKPGHKEIFAANQFIEDSITQLGKQVRPLGQESIHELRNMESEQYRIQLAKE